MISTSCFDGVIGIADCACPCIDALIGETDNDSASGLYLADLIQMSALSEVANCADPENPWTVGTRAIAQAKQSLLNDISRGLMKGNKPARDPYRGTIGERTGQETLTLTKTYGGIRIAAPSIRGGNLKITRLGGIFASGGNVTLQVYNRLNQAIGSPVTITTTAGSHAQSAAININLPLDIPGTPNPEYFITYTYSAGNKPKGNKVWCPSCKGTPIPSFSKTAPYYTRKFTGSIQWANWIMVAGWQGNSLTAFEVEAEQTTTETYLNGLTLDVELSCDPVQSVCPGGALDYSDPVGISIAHALRYMAAIKAGEEVMRSTKPSRAIAVSKEILAVDITNWYTRYQENIEFIIFNASKSASDCILCRSPLTMSIQPKLP